jgi:hypothetical protein
MARDCTHSLLWATHATKMCQLVQQHSKTSTNMHCVFLDVIWQQNKIKWHNLNEFFMV